MEGRTIVRPDYGTYAGEGGQVGPSMEGRTIVRPDLPGICEAKPLTFSFNGGPDNRPARPARRDGPLALSHGPSMEGRTIVRPDWTLDERPIDAIRPSMEGRTIVRPDAERVVVAVNYDPPSMEGRTIVRPDDPLEGWA